MNPILIVYTITQIKRAVARNKHRDAFAKKNKTIYGCVPCHRDLRLSKLP